MWTAAVAIEHVGSCNWLYCTECFVRHKAKHCFRIRDSNPGYLSETNADYVMKTYIHFRIMASMSLFYAMRDKLERMDRVCWIIFRDQLGGPVTSLEALLTA